MMNAKNIHFIGIGGIGISAIANILLSKGAKISGSDLTPSQITKSLKLKGVKVSYEHKASNISKKHDLVVFSPAIPSSNPELKQAKALKIPVFSYPKALGELSKHYYTIAIAGTHGKSTTTAMTTIGAIKTGLDPTVLIGTKLKELNNRNYRVGESNYLIMEACEYKRNFAQIRPNILIITNIEADHLDYYKNLTDYRSAFKDLASKVPKDGLIIAHEKHGIAGVTIAQDHKIPLKIPGKFNLDNANLAAEALTHLTASTTGIKDYKGCWRRMEYKKKLGKTQLIDDYAHHPTEIRLTLEAIRQTHKKANILVIYQPHQYNRTHHFLKEFGESFKKADQVIIPDIYQVRDSGKDLAKVSTDDLVKEIGKKAHNGKGLRNTAKFIKENHKDYDVIVTMGAGDIDTIYRWI